MIEPIPPHKIDGIRQHWRLGLERREIARIWAVSPTTVTKYCRDIPKPVEHRGRKRIET